MFMTAGVLMGADNLRVQAVATPLFAIVAPVAESGSKRRSFRGSHHVSGLASGSLLSDCKVVTGNRTMGSAHMARRVSLTTL